MLLLSCGLFLSACDDDNDPVAETGDFVVSLAIQGSDNTFTYYTVPFEDVMTGTLSAAGQGIEQPGYFDFTQIDKTIYSIGGLDDVNVVGISKNADGTLKQVGNVSFNNSLSDIVEAPDGALVSVTMASNSNVITFHTFNPNTVEVGEPKDVQVSAITELVGPSYSGMRIVGNHLFLSYYISDPNTYATAYTDQAEVAVFSYPELEFEKVITDTRVGPIGGFNIKSGLIQDESGNIYAVSHSNPANGYSQSTKPSGILRIKNGETEFDETYFFDIEEATEGFNATHLVYLGNGKAFAEINSAERDQQERWSDNPLRSAVIDLNTKAVNYISGLPEHKGDGRRLSALKDGNDIYLPIAQSGKINIYKVDTQKFSATKGAEVEANFIAGIFKL